MTEYTLEQEFEMVAQIRGLNMLEANPSNIEDSSQAICDAANSLNNPQSCSFGSKAFFIPFTTVIAAYAIQGDYHNLIIITTVTAAMLAGISGMVLFYAINALRHASP